MKFTDGYWKVLPGVSILRPGAVDEVVVGPESLTAYVSTGPLDERGDSLNRPLLTVSFHAPMDDVVGVTVEHFQGGLVSTPTFRLATAVADVEVVGPPARGAGSASFRAGALTARVAAGSVWGVDFVAGGRRLTGSSARSMATISDAGGRCFMREQLDLGVGERVFGLGERFGAFVKNGQSIDVWNADAGTSSDQAYKNVPFYLSDAGYGVFVDDPGRVSFEIGTEVVSRAQFSVAGQSLTYYVIYGPTPKDVLRKFTALTGRPPRLPEWSYGMWLSTSFTTGYDEETVTALIDGMAERELPLSVFHFDAFWMRRFHWCDFIWDPVTFPDPAGMLARLKARGVRICVWINPYIAQRSALFAQGRERGYLVRDRSGAVWQWDEWQAGMALVDFTNPDAVSWFQEQLRGLVEMGVDTFKTDFGERVPTEVVWHDGSDPVRMHNYYAHLYNEAVFELLEQEKGVGQAVVFARAATAGGQQFPVHWGGDSESTFVSMAETLRGGLSLALSGFAFWSHDIGGFEGVPDAAVFKRWLAFGLLSSHSRLHGSGSTRVPWAFDQEAVDVARVFTRLKLSLMPYLVGVGAQAHEQGLPVMRPMLVEFPEDRGAVGLDTQYMLGPSLLVAPVFSTEGVVDFYVPAGTWTHLLTGERVCGPRWVREVHGMCSLPVLVRPNTVLPIGARADRPDYDGADGVCLHLFELAPGHTSVTWVRGLGGEGGARFRVARDGDRVVVEAEGAVAAWSVRCAGGREVVADRGQTVVELLL